MPITPTFLLKASFDSYEDAGFWNEDDNTGDPYIGYPYQWRVTFTITPQQHSNHTTATPGYFTGDDIRIGDWYASGISGKAVVVKAVEAHDAFSATLLVEDHERFNLYSDPNLQGNGMVPSGAGVFFRLSSDGLPILGPIEEFYLATKAVEDLQARFIARNGVSEFVLVHQNNHGMFPGDVIYADFEADIGYKKVTAANFNRAIGIVTETNVPGLDYFSYRPLGRLINNVNPPLFGAHGDIFYLDPAEPGALTNEKPARNAVPIYLQLDLPTRAILLERGSEANSSGTAESETNKYDVESVSTGQTTFTLPADTKDVMYMAINGIENENFTFNVMTKVLEFDPVETGYGIDVDDEVFFIYKS